MDQDALSKTNECFNWKKRKKKKKGSILSSGSLVFPRNSRLISTTSVSYISIISNFKKSNWQIENTLTFRFSFLSFFFFSTSLEFNARVSRPVVKNLRGEKVWCYLSKYLIRRWRLKFRKVRISSVEIFVLFRNYARTQSLMILTSVSNFSGSVSLNSLFFNFLFSWIITFILVFPFTNLPIFTK